jgi:hypothetical protein
MLPNDCHCETALAERLEVVEAFGDVQSILVA